MPSECTECGYILGTGLERFYGLCFICIRKQIIKQRQKGYKLLDDFINED